MGSLTLVPFKRNSVWAFQIFETRTPSIFKKIDNSEKARRLGSGVYAIAQDWQSIFKSSGNKWAYYAPLIGTGLLHLPKLSRVIPQSTQIFRREIKSQASKFVQYFLRMLAIILHNCSAITRFGSLENLS